MSWNEILPIPSKKSLLDKAVLKTKKIRLSDKNPNVRKISSSANLINDTIKSIIESFPSMNTLHPFYENLIEIRMNKNDLKRELSRLNGTRKVVMRIAREMIKQKSTFNSYLGRLSSILKEDVFVNLKNYRKIFRTFPNINEHLFTVCIVGFPNVGKSTLLNKLSTSKADVNSYAFTTKTLNIGYIIKDYYTVQLIDTPGTLSREDKINNVEQQAKLALEYFSDLIIYVYDLTEAFPLKDQEKLDLELIKKYKHKIHYYFSKQDLLDKEKILLFAKKHGIDEFLTFEDLKEKLIKEARKRRSIL